MDKGRKNQREQSILHGYFGQLQDIRKTVSFSSLELCDVTAYVCGGYVCAHVHTCAGSGLHLSFGALSCGC